MRRIVGGVTLMAGLINVAAQGGVVVDLRPRFPDHLLQPGEEVPVDVFLYSETGEVLPNMRRIQFDVQSNTIGADSGNIFIDENDQSLLRWMLDDLVNPNLYFTDDPLPIPQANYTLPFPIPGALFDLARDPVKVARFVVTYLSDGYFDVTNPIADNEFYDDGAFFQSGFGVNIDGNPIQKFSSQHPGEVIGGRVFIPEPATLSLLLVGSVALLRRRRSAHS